MEKDLGFPIHFTCAKKDSPIISMLCYQVVKKAGLMFLLDNN